jgi:carbonic anhydrase
MGEIQLTDLNGQGPYTYKVNHMHMHGPSEHRLDGNQYDLEIHIVHELVDGPGNFKEYKESLAVVGFMFKVDTFSHPFIEKLRPMDFGAISQISFNELFQTLSQDAAVSAAEGAPVDEGDNTKRFYHYKGSLTNPPCADVVNWILHKKVLPITEEHLNAFKSVWLGNLGGHGNYRECQPLCGRRVVRNFEHVHDENCIHHTHQFGKDSMANQASHI